MLNKGNPLTMFETYFAKLCFLCPLIFVAMFIDSIAGGGGIITIPAYLFAGLPIQITYGTNKFVACVGTAFGAGNYIRKKYVDWRIAVPALCGSLAGSAIGAQLALHLKPEILQICLMIVLPFVALFMIFNRSFGDENAEKPSRSFRFVIIAAILIGLVIGCYDGLFGPGTGMFFSLSFVLIERMTLIYATGTTKVVNLASNFAAVVTYLMAGVVDFSIAIPCGLCSIAGCLLGSQCAIKKGAKFIKIIMIVAAMLLLGKLFIDFMESSIH